MHAEVLIEQKSDGAGVRDCEERMDSKREKYESGFSEKVL